jgi:hypothetical protein
VSPMSREALRSFLPAKSTSICDAGGGGGIRPDVRNRRAHPIAPTPAGLRLARRSAPLPARIRSRTPAVTIATITANSTIFGTANIHVFCCAPDDGVERPRRRGRVCAPRAHADRGCTAALGYFRSRSAPVESILAGTSSTHRLEHGPNTKGCQTDNRENTTDCWHVVERNSSRQRL